jgi:iron complex outermembrane recepter protein
LRVTASVGATCALVAFLGAPSMARAAASLDAQELTKLSIDELADLEVTLVSRRPERRGAALGANHVVTGAEGQRSGATGLADALRGSPGVQVSRIDANKWAVATRGFASRLSRSVLVLVDGRSVWTPLFSGVYWEQQDTLLDDVDRIEVHRGPGGALFGANAINGVINVVTRTARETPGLLLSAGAGTEERGFGRARYGGRLARDVYYRAYAKYFDRDGLFPLAGSSYDDWRMGQGGFRLDWEPGGARHFTLQGDVYDGDAGQRVTYGSYVPPFARTVEGDAVLRGGNLLGRWRRPLGQGGLQVQAYYDNTLRREPHYRERRDTFDVDVQHSFQPAEAHQVVWGAGYRASIGDFSAVPTIVMDPARRTDDIVGVFAQDEWTLAGGRGKLVLGARLDWDDYTGWHPQPRVRLGWALGPRQWGWAAVSRAVRTTARLEYDLQLTNALSPAVPLFARVMGSESFVPESVVSYEAGYRLRMGERTFVDAAVFHNEYDALATLEPGAPFVETSPGTPTRTVVPVTIANLQEGAASGAGVSTVVRVNPAWRLQASYSLVTIDQTPDPASLDRNLGYEGNSPRHQVWLSSFVTLGRAEVDLLWRWVDRIRTHRVEPHQELDARLGFRTRGPLRLDLVGQNLLHPRHVEFGGGFAVERGVYASATLAW